MRDINLESTIYPRFTTRAFATGIPTTLAGTPVLSVYEENNLTQITAGVSVTVDYDGVTGLNQATIVATAANGYEAGKSYDLVITTGTVGGVSVVGEIVYSFTVEDSAAATDLANATDGLSALKALIDTAQADLDIITDTDGVVLGAAGVDLIWDEVLTGATHNVSNSAGRRLRAIQEFQGYEDGAIWIDTINGTAGTTSYENGTVENAVDTIANANTLNTALTLNRFHLFPASSIILAATQSNQVFLGSEWILDLGGQNIAGTDFESASVSGIGTGANAHFQYCSIGNTTVAPARFGWCGFSGTLTVGSLGNYFIHDCYSEVAGASSPVIDMGAAVGATNVSIRRWSGGITINNLASGDIVSLDGTFGTITLNGADAQVEIRGIAKAVVNNLTGSPTVNDDSVKADSVEAILVDTGTTLPATLGTPAGADLATDVAAVKTTADAIETDTQDLQSRTPAALVGGRVDANVGAISTSTTAADNLEASALGVVPGACEGTPTTTVIQTDLAEATDDHYIGRVVVFTSGNAAGQASDITDYTGATGTITVTALTTAPAATDTFVIV